jgi:cell division ATPase FtsA
MSLFSFKKGTERIGAIIDIGSGSVLTAVVSSKPGDSAPTIIWSNREHAPLRNIDSIEQSAKSIMTALVNALLKFDVDGRRALYEYDKKASISEIQCCISAPWAYTVTKTIEYSEDDPFEVTKALLDELIETALKKTEHELNENEAVNQLGLTVITRSTVDILTNGYRIKNPIGEKTSEMALSHVSVVTQKYLTDHIDELKRKLFSNTVIHKLSYILAFYSVTQELIPDQHEICLVDITYEATEIGIVRDGSLKYSTHTPFGTFSLAREISNITSVPLYEAFQYLHNSEPLAFLKTLPSSQQDEIAAVIEAYTEKVTALFHETGDELSIPRLIYLHTDLQSEPFFAGIITAAGTRALKSAPDVKTITPLIIDKVNRVAGNQNSDTAMLVSAMFFHTQNTRRSFEYL